jgi:pimeloyl-ACP methyl ester carboxylesterase
MLILTYIKLWALYLLQDKIIFMPKVAGLKPIESPEFYGFKDTTDETIITEDGVKIHYWINHPTDKTKPYIVFFHGNAGHFGDLKSLTEKNNERGYRLHLLHDFADSGYGFIAVSLRGYGKSEGKPSEAGFVKDVAAITNIIKQNNYSIISLGESLGAFSALTLMKNLEDTNLVKMVVLIAPFSDMEEKAREIHTDFRKIDILPYLKHKFDNKSLVKQTKYRGKLLLIHPLLDEVSGVYHSKILQGVAVDNNKDVRMSVLPNAGHVTWNPDEVFGIINKNFNQ